MAGHLRDFTVTLSGSAQNLATVCWGSQTAPIDRPLVMIELQPGGANAAEVYVGGTSGVTSSAYGTRLEAADSGIPPAPWRVTSDGSTAYLYLSDVWVIGDNAETLHVMVQTSS